MLNFKKQVFEKEELVSQNLIPYSFTSIQISDGSIYMIGGLVGEVVSKQNWEIDPNMVVI